MTDSNSRKKKFAKLLVDWRTKHGWSREESAAKLGVSAAPVDFFTSQMRH
jgi:transcriptional regulator with XRE-family HTH domain